MLQIDTVPRDLQALPLAEQVRTVDIPKLTPLITLGFPLGSQTQAETINVSVTSGHVRRTFENMFQVDTSLHPGNSANDISKQRYLLGRLRELAPDDGNALVAQAFTAAMAEDWDSALSHARQFNALPGRINAAKLSVGLLEAELLHMQGHSAQARDSLETYGRRIADPWYRELSNCLMDPTHRGKVIAEAGESPENLLTGHTALGFWAEGSNDAPGALKHYREALGSYLDHRIEYELPWPGSSICAR